MNNPNLIELTGTIKRDLEERTGKNGLIYYFTFLQREDEPEDLPVFLWDPNYPLVWQAKEELTQNTQVTLFGKWNKDRSTFHFTEWKIEGLAVF